MTTISVKKVGGSYIASEDGTWIDGRFESHEDAVLAASICPSKLHAAWQASLQAGLEGLVTHDALIAIKTAD